MYQTVNVFPPKLTWSHSRNTSATGGCWAAPGSGSFAASVLPFRESHPSRTSAGTCLASRHVMLSPEMALPPTATGFPARSVHSEPAGTGAPPPVARDDGPDVVPAVLRPRRYPPAASATTRSAATGTTQAGL